MRIDKKQKIAGIPAITVRDFLAKVKDRLFTGSDAIRFLKIDDQTVTAISWQNFIAANISNCTT